MSNTFKSIIGLAGVATTMASIILSRSIMNIVRGFGDNSDLQAQLVIYNTIRSQYPQETEKLQAAVVRLYKRAKSEDTSDSMYDAFKLTPEQRAEWENTLPPSDARLLAEGVQDVVAAFAAAPANPEQGWNELSPLGQHSLLVAVENALPAKIQLYQSWTSERGSKLLGDALEAQQAIGELIENHYAEHADELLEHEDKLPERRAA